MDVRLSTEARDIAAIRAVIQEETDAFRRRDFDRWAACFVHDARTHEVSAGPDRGVIVHRGWDEVASAMRKIMAVTPAEECAFYAQDSVDVSVKGDLAWATFESRHRVRTDTAYTQPESFELRILERCDGQWHIVYLSFARLRDHRSARPIIQVDETARVIWASDKTLDALGSFEGLTISSGRLRATNRTFDKPLREAIARVAGHRHLFDSSYAAQSPDGLVYPCLLGEGETGGTLYCTVYVRDGVVNVSFRDIELVEGKLRGAAAIFGLSDAQRRMAREIANGRGLPEAADAMGIAVNTARTHLTRIYDKTGVRSQTALVRLLLSVGSLPDDG